MAKTQAAFHDTPDLSECLSWVLQNCRSPDGRPELSGDKFKGFYPAMLASAAALSRLPDEQAFRGLGHLAYGWMPTIIKSVTIPDNPRQFLNDATSACSVEDARRFIDCHLSGKIPPFNKSWVGTSKVLHFLAPSAFPIWDSRVRKHFVQPKSKPRGGKTTTVFPGGNANNRSSYLEYLDFCEDHHALPPVRDFMKLQQEWEGAAATSLRCLEFLLYLSAPKRHIYG